MNTISSYTAPANAAATTSNAAVTDATTTAATTDESSEQKPAAQFSTRAEKLAALNSEFDIVSPSFKLSQQFVNRMAELDLISASDAEGLNTDLPLTASSGTDEADTVGELTTFIDSFSAKLEKQEDAPSGLLEILQNSKSILQNLDGSKSKTFEADIPETAAALADYLRSSDASSLSDSETKSLNDLHTALTVADKLNPTSRTSDNINAYMRVMGDL